MNEHYFTARPGSSAERRTVRFRAYGREYELASSTGVFSGDRLDLGTSVLLREAPPPRATGTFLDLGCGYGPIACVLAMEAPGATVWAVDVNTRALELARANADALGMGERIRVRQPDEVPPDVRFDQIWSNPPIRIGKAALHELLSTWLSRLADDGEAWLVVGRNLGADPLQRWLNEQEWLAGRGLRATRRASAKGFRVLSVSRPGRV